MSRPVGPRPAAWKNLLHTAGKKRPPHLSGHCAVLQCVAADLPLPACDQLGARALAGGVEPRWWTVDIAGGGTHQSPVRMRSPRMRDRIVRHPLGGSNRIGARIAHKCPTLVHSATERRPGSYDHLYALLSVCTPNECGGSAKNTAWRRPP